jgi:large subunit ribosomal protein L19|uniref:ribosomal protein L19 n=1 Tax=Fibrocapsa japonica TaxID=94617 RepID=UPI0021155F16|nr:ribosomal protein L19 [Fibrocapsa japonica]UTE95218.1 ribosomal protein L19 [Fibrocapsa japonica]
MVKFLVLFNVLLQKIEGDYLNTKTYQTDIGDTVRLGIKIREGSKERIQYYEGVVISKKNSGINKSVCIRKIVQGIGIERIFLLNSPKILSLEIKKSAKVKKSKLYFLRKLSGKATRLKQKY